MGATRNGSRRPEEGERGVAAASSYLGEPVPRYSKRKVQPTPAQLERMVFEDGWAAAIEGAISWPIRSLEWSIEPADEDRGEAEEVREQMEDLVEPLIAGMSSAAGRAVAFFEQVWEYDRRRGRIVLKDIVLRPVDQCEPMRDKNGRITGFKQRAFAGGRGTVNEEFLLSERKAFIFLHNEAARPGAGSSALIPTYHNYTNGLKYEFYRDRLLEKYGGPTTHAKTDARKGSQEWRDMENVARDARSGASVVTDRNTEIDYLMPPNAGMQFRNARRDAQFESAVSQFVQNLSLAEAGNSGAFALSRDHSDLRTIVADARVREQNTRVTNGPIADIVFWNFGPDGAIPRFTRPSLSENMTERVLRAAESLFGQGYPIPSWAAQELVVRWARAIGLEVPEGAEEVEEAGVAAPTPDTEEDESS